MAHLMQISEPDEIDHPISRADEIAVGIDLGTTHSLVAIADEGNVEVLALEDKQKLIPSIVAYTEREPIVGLKARDLMIDSAESVVTSAKRHMGQNESALTKSISFDAHKFSAVDVSADILRYLKERAEATLGKKVHQAVITVPAYFDERARAATREAAQRAGIEVLRLISEPTAAALAYGLDTGNQGIYAIYDLGGGTFDFSLLKLEKGVFQVLATGGDTKLGGDDIDHILLDLLLEERSKNSAKVYSKDRHRKSGLLQARQLKENLTNELAADCKLIFGNDQTDHCVTRDQLDDLSTKLIDRTLAICKGVLQDAGLAVEDVQGVVLVGGATHMPLVQDKIHKFFAQKGLHSIDPDQAVVRGAALQAAALTQGSSTLLLDVTPLSLGIETLGDLVDVMIPRNSRLPAAQTQEFTTYLDNQTSIRIHVLQGEAQSIDQCRSLAEFIVQDIPKMPAGQVRLAVTFTLDADGLLQVKAQEKTTGIEQSVVVKPSYGLTEEQMVDLIRNTG